MSDEPALLEEFARKLERLRRRRTARDHATPPAGPPALHEGQERASGEPYFIHPLAVAAILIDLKLDAQVDHRGAPARRPGGHGGHAGGALRASSARRWSPSSTG